MKKLLTFVAFAMLFFNTSFAQSLKPLQNYIDENANSINDPVVVSYMLKRCGAVYIFASAVTKDISEEQAESLGEASNEAILNAGRILIEKLKWTEDEASQSLRTEVTKMVEYYKKDGTDFFARTGLYMKGNYIGDDLFFCKKIIEKFR